MLSNFCRFNAIRNILLLLKNLDITPLKSGISKIVTRKKHHHMKFKIPALEGYFGGKGGSTLQPYFDAVEDGSKHILCY